MSSPESASALPDPPRVRDRALWTTAQQMMAEHLCCPAGDRCANPKCGADYPCVTARTAARLAAASMAPFHQKMTALLDARSCEVPPPAFFGLVPLTEATGPGQVELRSQPAGGRTVSPVDDCVLAVSA